ncbi:MAG: DUF3656 domain-containing U32 family peptidase [Lachnospiraceae bacterium]
MKTHDNNRQNLIEILSPAGSYQSLEAAVNAGADAVYIGGSRFGARAYADNLDTGQLLSAIDYAHLHGRKIYLTVNTLLKETELEKELFAYLEPFYCQGLDAVIVQDIGVLSFIREQFPDLPVHASTQMTITDTYGVRFLEEQGVSRVVLARELNLPEIAAITSEVSAEIECFVHGALCYCYSGQCLYSSLIGGRSGNRGQCAQPCRLPYQVGKETFYLMSLKDICTLEHVPALIEAGITSFKIEGRMKKPEYVAAVTSMYRKYVDLYFEEGSEKYTVEQKDIEMLLDVYNRGGFHTGYLNQHNGQNMVADKRPNHAGIPAVRVIGNKRVQALREINPGDVLELINSRHDYTFGGKIRTGEIIDLPMLQKGFVKPGTILNRVRNEQLLQSLHDRFVSGQTKEKIKGKLMLSAGKPATLLLCFGAASITITGNMVQKALNQPMDEARIRKQMFKTGSTPFEFESLDISLVDDIFIPVHELNELRRMGIEALTQAILSPLRRKKTERALVCVEEKQSALQKNGIKIHVSIVNHEQFKVACSYAAVERIYVDSNIPDHSYAEIGRKAGKEVFLAMPYIFRKKTREVWERNWKHEAHAYDGMLVRNYESFAYLKEQGYKGSIITDHNLYIFNQRAEQFWMQHGAQGMTLPLELNRRELKQLKLNNCEIIAYGYLPMMITASCIRKNTGRCTGESSVLTIKDRYKKQFMVKNNCDYCYNIIYNTLPLSLADQRKKMQELGMPSLRLMFTVETATESAAVLDVFCEWPEVDNRHPETEFTRGHFKRGIK